MKKPLKKTRAKKFMCAVMAVAVVIQCMAALTLTVSAETAMPTYKQTEAFANASGAQGYNGWYYMYKDYSSDGAYKKLTWDTDKFGDNDKNVNTNFIVPGYSSPTAIVWEAQHTGIVTLKVTNNTIYRSGTREDAGNLTLTLSINDTVKWQDELSLDATSGNGTNYELKNVSLKKGDRIYYEVDCHKNKTYADVYWHPEVEYTTLYADNAKTFRMYDAIQVAGYRCQGYDGWYYMRETSAGYENLKEIELVNGVTPRWKTTGTDNTVTGSTTMPGWNSPTVLAWRAPYTGTVTLTTRNNDNNAREDLWRSASHASGGTVTANILLNDTQVKQNDGTDAKWEFLNTDGPGVNQKRYEITGVKVNAGDMIYHKVDCGTNNASPAIHWQPYIVYTDIETPVMYYNDSNYIKANDFTSANGTQGYNGWNYMYKASGIYKELPWDGSKFIQGDGKVYEKMINPGWNSPTAIVWKAPYTGVVNLGLTEPMFRAAADASNANCGDITATILHNGAQLKQNDGTDAQWVFDNATKEAASNKTYDIKDISVQKGDLLYFEVDCGTKNAYIDICWSPTVKYTAYINAEENYVKAFSATNAWVLIAQYNNDNTLVSINPYDATANNAIRCKVSPATGATNYKVFVWDNSEDKMLPLLTPNGETF